MSKILEIIKKQHFSFSFSEKSHAFLPLIIFFIINLNPNAVIKASSSSLALLFSLDSGSLG